MSHTIGQLEPDNQQPPITSQDSQQPVEQSSREGTLSDGDYEFLFNQLLEGIAHGWRDRRIIKFFQQLDDRGKQDDWVAWLDRLRLKVIELPVQSKRQLGTMMIRLGELTQSTKEVNQIGAASNRIGRELLFGNAVDIIWEYVGPDLSLAAVEAPESTLAERLPTEFTDLSSSNDPAQQMSAPASAQSEVVAATKSQDLSPTASKISLEEAVSQRELETRSHLESQPDQPTAVEIELNLDPPEASVVQSEIPPEAKNLSETELLTAFKEPANAQEQNILEHDLLSPIAEKTEPELVQVEQTISSVQKDEELEGQVLALNSDANEAVDSSGVTETGAGDLELIESWFNLGLKQVSAGEFNQAIASWEKALKINPNLSEAWHNRGSALGRLGEYEQAVTSFQQALTIDPQNYQAWNDCAHALYQLQQWADAVNSWSNALQITPANHLFWYNRGCGLEQLENWTEAIVSYEKSLEIKPDFQPARSRYINLIAGNS